MPPRRTGASAHRCRAVADRASTANIRRSGSAGAACGFTLRDRPAGMRRLPPAISSDTAATAAGRRRYAAAGRSFRRRVRPSASSASSGCNLMDAAALTLARSALPAWPGCTWVSSTAAMAETSRPRAPRELLIAADLAAVSPCRKPGGGAVAAPVMFRVAGGHVRAAGCLVRPVYASRGRLVLAAGPPGDRRPVWRRQMGWLAGPTGPGRSRPGRPRPR